MFCLAATRRYAGRYAFTYRVGVEVMGFEPTASSMRPKRSSQLSYTPGTGDDSLTDGLLAALHR